MARVKYLPVRYSQLLIGYPNIDVTGSIKGMKKLYWGLDALVVRSGSYYYKVPTEVYHNQKCK